MTNPITPTQFYWISQAIQAMTDLMPEAVVPREVVAGEIKLKAGREGRSFIKRNDVESYFGYCQSVSA